MQIYRLLTSCLFALLACSIAETSGGSKHHGHHRHHKHKHTQVGHKHQGHHHKGHHHHHRKHRNGSIKVDSHLHPAAAATEAKAVEAMKQIAKAANVTKREDQLVVKMKMLESRLAAKKKAQAMAPPASYWEKGHLLLSGPLPANFPALFAEAVAGATGAVASKVRVANARAVKQQPGVVSIEFIADHKVVKDVEKQATDPDSKLAEGKLHSFLVAKDDNEDGNEEDKSEKPDASSEESDASSEDATPAKEEKAASTPVQEKGLDIDTAMPYGELEPFGREDTAQELTEDSITESDGMVDQLERAEVAEEKRAIFRALTRLRGAAITSFDGIARAQTGSIDEYNKIHKWRNNHPLHHLADEESDVSKWAFPDNADF